MKIRFFYQLDQRLSAFYSSVCFNLIIGYYIFPNIYIRTKLLRYTLKTKRVWESTLRLLPHPFL